MREGGGPRFLHVHTYRLTGHTGADPAAYRPKEEVEARWRDDPIARLRRRCLRKRRREGRRAHGRRATRPSPRCAQAYDAAKATPYPPVEHAFADVQDVGDPRREAF